MNVETVVDAPCERPLIKYSYRVAPVVPLASKRILSPSQTTSLINPELKLTVGAAFGSTVMVTILEDAEAIFEVHCTPLKVA